VHPACAGARIRPRTTRPIGVSGGPAPARTPRSGAGSARPARASERRARPRWRRCIRDDDRLPRDVPGTAAKDSHRPALDGEERVSSAANPRRSHPGRATAQAPRADPAQARAVSGQPAFEHGRHRRVSSCAAVSRGSGGRAPADPENWQVHGRIRDTRDDPTETGYRALHVIVVRDGRRIEIQLRTPREHEWAVAVERTGTRLGYGLKEGEGPSDLLEYFRLASRGLYLESIGADADPRLMSEFLAMQAPFLAGV
jgi:hypothetical protein